MTLMLGMSSNIVMDMRIAVVHVVRHMHGGCCHHCGLHHHNVRRAMRHRIFHGHDIACQPAQGKQQHHEQGKKAAHGVNDTGRGD